MLITDLKSVPIRALHALNRVGIYTVEDLTAQTEDDLMAIHDFGVKFLNEIVTALDSLGLSLKNCSIPETMSKVVPPMNESSEDEITCYEVYYDLYVHVTGSIVLDKKPITQKDQEKMIFSNEGIRNVEEITTNPIDTYEGHLTIKKRQYR